MRFVFLCCLLISFRVFAQEGLDSRNLKGISIPAVEEKTNLPKFEPKTNTKKPSLPSIDLYNPLTESKPFYMNEESDLLDAGEELQKKWDESKLKVSAKYDQYLGDFKTKSSYLGLQCRDFGRVDGDYVRIIVNDVVVRNSLRLVGSFKGINIDLVEGLNRIDIIAINEGTASPNTGHFAVLDTEGKIITSQKWNLFSSGKATMVVLKEN
jgi:hypothetical protein